VGGRPPNEVHLAGHCFRALARFWISATVAGSSEATFTANPLPVEATFAFTPLSAKEPVANNVCILHDSGTPVLGSLERRLGGEYFALIAPLCDTIDFVDS
jgi:hypothetical protein